MFDNLSFKMRRWLVLLVLLVGMPLYIVAAVELIVYVGLGLAWIFPFKGLFKGIGKPDPDAAPIKWDDEV